MKIEGVAGKKHPTLKRGDAIELSPEKKIQAMACEAVVKSSPNGYLYVPLTAEIKGEVRVIKGRKDIKNPEPNQYLGTALVRFRPHKLDTDRVFSVKTQKVKVHCKDAKDTNGIPDLERVEDLML